MGRSPRSLRTPNRSAIKLKLTGRIPQLCTEPIYAVPAARIPYDEDTRKALAKSFIENVVLAQYRQLTGWQKVTQQTSQLDSGYLGQHLVSLISGVPGRGAGSRGKGLDLIDNSEIKVASTPGAINTPRWNHTSFGKRKNVDAYLARRHIYFVLLDTPERRKEFPLRIRVWRVAPQTDALFADLVERWAGKKSSGNFQLQPPRWKAGSIAKNKCGDLVLPLIFEAVQQEIPGVDFMEIERWNTRARKCRTLARD